MSNKDDITKELDELELDAGIESDDYFEKVLAGEDNIDGDELKDTDDPGTETSNVKNIESSQSKGSSQNDEVKRLKDEIARLQREAKGRLNDVVQSRQERSQFKAELNQLQSAVTELLSKRTNTNLVDEPKKVPLQETKTPVKFDDDDSAFVDLSDVKEAIKAETELTKKDLEQLKVEREFEKLQAEYRRNVNAIINEDPDVFGPAYTSLQTVFKDLNDSIIELQKRTGEMGENGVLSQEVALELFDGSPEEKEFIAKHPGIDPTRIARAFDTKIDLRKSLRHVSEMSNQEDPKKTKVGNIIDEKVKAAKQKPGSLAKVENQAGATLNLIDRIATLSFSDLESMSDSEAAKIEALLLKEELKGD